MKQMFAVAFSLFGLAVAAATAAIPSPTPNVVFIISDDHAWNDYSFMGHPHIATPNLDRLAAQSLTFERGYTPVPLCRPALASIVTGLYPHQHGVTGNDPELPDQGVNAMAARGNPKYARYYETIIANFAKRPNLVRDLVSRGYAALQTGKWWEGDPIKTAGFTHAMTAGEGKGDRHGGAGLSIGRDSLEPIYAFIEQAGNKPFFVWYAPMLPHAPHTPPDDLLRKYLNVATSEPVARYWASVEWFDRTCGELLSHLEAKRLRSNMIVIYTTDNGWIQNPEKANQFAPRSKLTPYEGGVRTPIMISWPGRVKPHRDAEHLASNVDLWPTLAGLLRTPTPRGLPGINLTDARAVARRSQVFGEQYAHNIADVDHLTRSLQTRWIIDGWWKLLAPDPRNCPDAKPELYDLRKDLWEKNDLASQEPRRVQRLTRKLDQWWQPSNEP
ncbi:MAG TPA: sulfatase-like hydrolase/transferase [Verrucomicrobiae bacterium]